MAAGLEVRRRFWLLIGTGAFAADAAASVGVDSTTGERWFRDAGGMPPISLDPPSSRYLCLADREQILAGISAGDSIRAIARRLGRAPSTIQRELRGNMFHQQYRSRRSLDPHAPGPQVRVPWKYSPSRAQGKGERARARPKVATLAGNARLHDQVQTWLLEKYSPEQISHRLRCDFAQDPEMRVSHETIYQSLYVQGRGALRRDLTACLRTGRTLRRPRRRVGERRERITDMVNIADRPPEVDDRRIPGHWEGDLITGAHNGSAIGTLVERTTGFVLLLHLPDSHGATQVADQMITQMSRLPDLLRKTVTWDQGIEMSEHARISLATDLDIYFCDPHSPWQRGSNENTNGLLRQYFPKGTDLSGYHPDYLDYVAAQLNDRPRKRHNWQTPREVLTTLLNNPTPPTVASTS
jgi:transposase, IS30 family